jgi:hypothetical protein
MIGKFVQKHTQRRKKWPYGNAVVADTPRRGGANPRNAPNARIRGISKRRNKKKRPPATAGGFFHCLPGRVRISLILIFIFFPFHAPEPKFPSAGSRKKQQPQNRQIPQTGTNTAS